jgi:hypothetical protein
MRYGRKRSRGYLSTHINTNYLAISNCNWLLHIQMGGWMKARLAAVISWLMTVSYTIFPSHAAEEVKELLYREDQPNVQKEIKWTKSLSQYYAKSLMAAQYEQWDTKSEFRALAKLWGKESAWNHTAA